MIAHSFSFRQDQKEAIYLASLHLSMPMVRCTLGIAHVRWGKTKVGLKIAEDYAKTKGIVIVTPRREVMHQWREACITYREHAALDVVQQYERVAFDFQSVGLIGDGHREFSQVNICTLKSAHMHMAALLEWMKDNEIRPGLLIFDEAQYGLSDTAREMLDLWINAGGKVLFLTATPGRSDGQSLNKYITSVCFEYTPEHGVKRGVLVNDRKIVGQGSEPHEIVEDWLTYASGRSTIAFTRTMDEAELLAEEFNLNGIPAGCITSRMPHRERDWVMRRYLSGEIVVLTNVQVVTDGIDANRTSCIILANGVATDTPYIQRVGRALGKHSDDELGIQEDAIVILSDVPRGIEDLPSRGIILLDEERLRTAALAWTPTRIAYKIVKGIEAASQPFLNIGK